VNRPQVSALHPCYMGGPAESLRKHPCQKAVDECCKVHLVVSFLGLALPIPRKAALAHHDPRRGISCLS
jgi:hypothetical protein